MSNDLIEKLNKLKKEESCLKRNIDTNFFDKKTRIFLFDRQQQLQKEIQKINFKLNIEREIQNANNNSNKPNN